jgi:uncharacterized protein (DUF983 family)/phenylpyruvate tautomerase PptA (4-oxalocrotonate tautomerase family)
MATYTIQIPGGQLSDERKAALPEAIKDAHANTTGAPRDFTQATVLEISSACFWLHGTPLECHQIFVHGFVADDAGHSCGPALRDAVASAVASAADFELGSVVVTISEVPADKMKPAVRGPSDSDSLLRRAGRNMTHQNDAWASSPNTVLPCAAGGRAMATTVAGPVGSQDEDWTSAETAAGRKVGLSLWRGLRGRCPRCGRGRLFCAFLKVDNHCSVCRLDFTGHRADDLPAYLVIVIVGHVLVPVIL